MKQRYLAAAALALALHAPAYADRTPSAHIQCDGQPDDVTAGETAARLIGAVTLLGLFAPQHETANLSLRLSGAEGVAICNNALSRETNDVRRMQLILATAIHQLEANNADAAIAAARQVATDRPAFAATTPFRTTFRLSAMEIEAQALLTAGRTDEAIAKALEMAAAAPYDILAQIRAERYVRLSPRFGENEQAFYGNLIRVYPAAITTRALQRQMAGDFRGGAEDYETWMRLERSVIGHADMESLAQTALTQALAGNLTRAEELAGQAREAIQGEPGSTLAAGAAEILDLYQIWKNVHEGRAADARTLFANRSAWLKPAAPTVAEIARLLQQGAPASALMGSLAGDPARFRTAVTDRRRRELIEDRNRYAAIRPFYPQSSFDRFGANVWANGDSRYFARSDNVQMNARPITVSRDGGGIPANYALMLHAALTARARNKRAFMLLPAQSNVAAAFVRFGDPGDEAMIDAMSFDTDRVINDLAPIIPRPAAQH